MTTAVEECFQGPLVLDGGMATELERGGADLRDELWSARLLKDDPTAILRVHEAFFDAGADVAISASYQASFSGFADRGIEAEEAASLMRRSVALAREAAAAADDPSSGGGLVGPFGATLADGSEYRGDYGLSAGRSRCSIGRGSRPSSRPNPISWRSRRSRRSSRPRLW